MNKIDWPAPLPITQVDLQDNTVQLLFTSAMIEERYPKEASFLNTSSADTYEAIWRGIRYWQTEITASDPATPARPNWVKSFLYDRTQRVRVGKKFSSSADVLSGIPQGSILGPVLFTIFINDIADNINSFCRIFADDTKIFNITKNSITLQEDLAKLQEWSFNGVCILM